MPSTLPQSSTQLNRDTSVEAGISPACVSQTLGTTSFQPVELWVTVTPPLRIPTEEKRREDRVKAHEKNKCQIGWTEFIEATHQDCTPALVAVQNSNKTVLLRLCQLGGLT